MANSLFSCVHILSSGDVKAYLALGLDFETERYELRRLKDNKSNPFIKKENQENVRSTRPIFQKHIAEVSGEEKRHTSEKSVVRTRGRLGFAANESSMIPLLRWRCVTADGSVYVKTLRSKPL